jgi:hypothetical protein
MSWARPSDFSHGTLWNVTRPQAPYRRPVAAPGRVPTRSGSGLGVADAAREWTWSGAPEHRFPGRMDTSVGPAIGDNVVLRVPTALLREMTRAARLAGRSEGELWAEAAREWLARRARGDEPQPPDPSAAALPVPRAPRSWSAIDSVLSELRRPQRLVDMAHTARETYVAHGGTAA